MFQAEHMYLYLYVFSSSLTTTLGKPKAKLAAAECVSQGYLSSCINIMGGHVSSPAEILALLRDTLLRASSLSKWAAERALLVDSGR